MSGSLCPRRAAGSGWEVGREHGCLVDKCSVGGVVWVGEVHGALRLGGVVVGEGDRERFAAVGGATLADERYVHGEAELVMSRGPGDPLVGRVCAG